MNERSHADAMWERIRRKFASVSSLDLQAEANRALARGQNRLAYELSVEQDRRQDFVVRLWQAGQLNVNGIARQNWRSK